jgi:COMPASS component SWD2
MSPVNDTFLSASVDGCVYLWELTKPVPIAKFMIPDSSVYVRVAHDPDGIIACVLVKDQKTEKQHLHMYNVESCPLANSTAFLDVAPSIQFVRAALSRLEPVLSPLVVEKYLSATWTDFEFSPDGKHILVNTNTDMLLIIDAFEGNTKEPMVICSRKNESGLQNLGFCYSADGRYIVAANDNREIAVYDANTGSTVTILT